MTAGELLWILAACGYAVYQQTRRHEVVGGSTRFKLAVIYAVIGLVVGGFNPPKSVLSIAFLLLSLTLSLAVGVKRGRLTRLWNENGRVYSQGTPQTIALFLALVASKFILGSVAYAVHAADDGGIGEVLLMIAVMIAVQAELIWRRARPLGARTSTDASPSMPGGGGYTGTGLPPQHTVQYGEPTSAYAPPAGWTPAGSTPAGSTPTGGGHRSGHTAEATNRYPQTNGYANGYGEAIPGALLPATEPPDQSTRR